MKTALVFVDNQTINVVLGKLLKQVKISDIGLDHNVEFFETLFSEHRVLIVDQVLPLSKEEFYQSFDAEMSQSERLMEAEAPGPRNQTYEQTLEDPPRSQRKQAAKPSPPRPKESDSFLPKAGGGIWLKSNAKSIVIIDDIYTNQELKNVPGSKMSLAIQLGRAIDISTLDKEQVKKSTILRKLLSNGTLVECSYAEAMAIEDRYWASENKKRLGEDKDLDKMLLPAGMKAVDAAAGAQFDPDMIDLTNEREDNPEPEEYDDLLKTMRKNRDEPAQVPVSTQMSLTEQIALAEQDSGRRSTLTRERAEVDPNLPRKGFRRLEE